MNDHLVDVTNEGAILLGPDIVCDGFYYGPKARVQTHIHTDHMEDFDRSKGMQKILLTHETFELLKFIKNADIPIRSNIIPLDYNHFFKIGSSKVKILSNGHMMGSVQVEVTLEDGLKVGYSGDFKCPFQDIINVNTLIVDSSCGSLDQMENYREEEVIEKFIDLVLEKIHEGPIQLTAHRGTLQRALDIINMELDIPIIGNDYLIKETQIYKKFGYCMPEIMSLGDDCKSIINSRRYIQIRSHFGQNPAIKKQRFTHISLRRHGDKNNPIRKTESNTYAVALSAHSNAEETIKYIEKTGADYVITDNNRGGRAVELAQFITNRLGINARASNNEISHNWK